MGGNWQLAHSYAASKYLKRIDFTTILGLIILALEGFAINNSSGKWIYVEEIPGAYIVLINIHGQRGTA